MSWVANVQGRARLLHEQIAAVQTWSAAAGATDNSTAALLDPYYQLLNNLYEEDFPLAAAVDTSDLVLRAEGPAVNVGAPSLAVVTGLFGDFRKEVQRITKSIIGLSLRARLRLPPEFDLRLSGVAKGSLIIGFKVGRPIGGSPGDIYGMFGPEDPLYLSVRDAVRNLASVTRFITDDGVSGEIDEQIPDPGIRDTVMVSAHRLAPTGKRGITGISLYGSSEPQGPQHALTPVSKKMLSQFISKPEKVSGDGEFIGVVREIDLDAKRFEIRGQNAPVIRCVYSNQLAEAAKAILDRNVKVSGKYESSKDGQPRLLFVERLEVDEEPPPLEQTWF